MNPSVTSPRAESAPVDETESSETGESRARPGRRSVEDRQRAVLELMSGRATVDQLARRLGVLPSTVEGWRDDALAGIEEALRRGSGEVAPEPLHGGDVAGARVGDAELAALVAIPALDHSRGSDGAI